MKLIQIDPEVKKYITSTDTQRSIRAYEVKKYTKKSIYDWFKNTKPKYEDKEFYKICIDFPRIRLVKKIAVRTHAMIENGAIREVKNFMKLKVPKNKTSSKAIGIQEIGQYLNKKIEIKEVIEKISIKTRQYAKRQTTWARGQMSDWIKINPNSLNKFLKKF